MAMAMERERKAASERSAKPTLNFLAFIQFQLSEIRKQFTTRDDDATNISDDKDDGGKECKTHHTFTEKAHEGSGISTRPRRNYLCIKWMRSARTHCDAQCGLFASHVQMARSKQVLHIYMDTERRDVNWTKYILKWFSQSLVWRLLDRVETM